MIIAKLVPKPQKVQEEYKLEPKRQFDKEKDKDTIISTQLSNFVQLTLKCTKAEGVQLCTDKPKVKIPNTSDHLRFYNKSCELEFNWLSFNFCLETFIFRCFYGTDVLQKM